MVSHEFWLLWSWFLFRVLKHITWNNNIMKQSLFSECIQNFLLHECFAMHMMTCQILMIGQNTRGVTKVIGYFLGFKISLFSCPSGISLVCLPHRCHRISETRWGDYPVLLSQDEGQVNLFLNIKNKNNCMPWFQRWSKSKHTTVLIH